MALTTKAELRATVKLRFIRDDKDALINDALDQNLKTAVRAHKFTDIIGSEDVDVTTAESSVAMTCTNFGVPVKVFALDGVSSYEVKIRRLTELLSLYPDLTQWEFSNIAECYFVVSAGSATIYFPALDGAQTLRVYYYKKCELVNDTDANPIESLDSFLVNQTVADCFAGVKDFESANVYAGRAAQEFKTAMYNDVTQREHRQFAEFMLLDKYVGSSPWYDPFIRKWN
jgi:hypothetical protein